MEAWKWINWRYLCLSELNVSWSEEDMHKSQKSGPNSKCNGPRPSSPLFLKNKLLSTFLSEEKETSTVTFQCFNVSTFRSWTSISNSDCWKQRSLADYSIVHIITTKTNTIIIITRPKPAYGRQGLVGSLGQDTDQAGTFWGVLNVSLRASSAQLRFKPTWNH